MTATPPPLTITGSASTDQPLSVGEQLLALGHEINANQYRVVHLAARYDEELEWFHAGHKTPAHWISCELGIHSSTAREWIRVGHALRYLPSIDAAFAANEVSFAKVRILTRWADPDNEAALLALAHERSADRLTTAIAKHLADNDDETDEERDRRHHEARALTTWTDGDGMTVIRITLPPHLAKRILAAIDALVRMIAATPRRPHNRRRPHQMPASTEEATTDGGEQPPAGGSRGRGVATRTAKGGEHPPAGGSGGRSVTTSGPCDAGLEPPPVSDADSVARTLDEVQRRWQPDDADDDAFPTLAQQRIDAFVVLFLQRDVDIQTELIIHVRGDGITFDDGTPTTTSAVMRQLDDAFIRLLIHDAERRPVNASSRRRHPTAAQKRVVLETHGHECVDCQRTDLLELDHDPPYAQTGRTVTGELEPRCAPCHRARHRFDGRGAAEVFGKDIGGRDLTSRLAS